MAEVIVGTAGHVDHGKTSLVMALTGQNTDRLPEEQRRGVSIDLGFAEFHLPSGRRAGIVDVPGHERFIKNMVAGATGIDLVLLVVAADEGVMPQTREHLDILQLLGVSAGVVVITKIDLVDEDWLELVEEEVREELAGTFLADAPVVRVSSRTGEGLDRLRAVVDEWIPRVRTRPEDAYGRLPIDRVFTVAGFGTVVTGTLVAGRIEINSHLEVQPGGRQVRVRQLQVHGRPVSVVTAGQRVAVNLVGVDKEDLRRGQVLVVPGTLRAVRLFAAALELLPHAERPLRSGTRVRLHTGTSEVLGRCLLLDREELAPGERCYMLFRAESDVVVARGDRYIIRTYSPMHTIGGGVVLDPGRRYRRYRDESTHALAILESADTAAITALLLERAGEPVTPAQLRVELNLPQQRVQEEIARLVAGGQVIALDGGAFLLHQRVYEELIGRSAQLLESFHRKAPLRMGMSREELRRELVPGLDAKAFADLLDRLAQSGAVEVNGDLVRRPGFEPQLDERLRQAMDRMAATYAEAAAAPPTVSELGQRLQLNPAEMRALLETLVEGGRLVRVNDELYFDATAYERLVTAVCRRIMAEGPQTVAEIRDHLGTSRKYVVPFLEHLDQVAITRRLGDRRDLTPRGRERAAHASGA